MKKNKNFLQKLLGKNFKDSDADGLSDEFEKQIGTNPYKKDTDDDGVNDLEEVFVYETDPNNPDTDKDGVSDGDEIKRGSNPNGFGNLKNFFIANKNNNYSPEIFDYKRLTLYTVSGVFIKVILILVAVFLPVRAWLTPDILLEESKKVVQLTNQFRQEQGVDTLETSQKLTQAAFDKCQDMMINQYFSHLGPNNRSVADWITKSGYDYVTAGENLALGFSKAPELVQAWKDSASHRQNLLDPDFSEIGVAMASGEFEKKETTLVAQYFAKPFENKQFESILNTESNIEEEVQTEENFQTEEDTNNNDIENNSDIDKTDTQVLSQKQDKETEEVETEKTSETIEETGTTNDFELSGEVNEPIEITNNEIILKKPSLEVLSIQNNLNNQVKISFSAPEAEKIQIYSNNSLIKEIYSPFEDTETFLTLESGRYNLYLKSFYEDQVKESDYKKIVVNSNPLKIYHENTFAQVVEVNNNTQSIIRVEAKLSPNTTEAKFSYKDEYSFNLEKNSDGIWTGSSIFKTKKQKLFDPVILANLEIKDKSGNTLSENIDFKDIEPVTTSSLDQYFYLKDNSSPFLSLIYDIAYTYYYIILSIVLLVLGINIILNIKKQKKKVILPVLSFILIFFFLIWF